MGLKEKLKKSFKKQKEIWRKKQAQLEETREHRKITRKERKQREKEKREKEERELRDIAEKAYSQELRKEKVRLSTAHARARARQTARAASTGRFGSARKTMGAIGDAGEKITSVMFPDFLPQRKTKTKKTGTSKKSKKNKKSDASDFLDDLLGLG